MTPIRARDLRANIAELGFEKGVVTTLELLLDEFAQYRQHMREVVSLLDQCIDNLHKLDAFGDAIKRQIDQVKRDRGTSDEIDGEPKQ